MRCVDQVVKASRVAQTPRAIDARPLDVIFEPERFAKAVKGAREVCHKRLFSATPFQARGDPPACDACNLHFQAMLVPKRSISPPAHMTPHPPSAQLFSPAPPHGRPWHAMPLARPRWGPPSAAAAPHGAPPPPAATPSAAPPATPSSAAAAPGARAPRRRPRPRRYAAARPPG